MKADRIDWMNLDIENCNFCELAKNVIPNCEFPVRPLWVMKGEV